MQKRIFSVSLALFLLFMLICSVTFLGTQAEHEHIGETDCAICRQMQDCSERLTTPAACPSAERNTRIFAPVQKVTRSRRSENIRFGAHSPVSLKDKLTS